IFGKRKANIFTLTDTSGNFQLKNLREDAYRIYALKEENNDRIYNGSGEYIGFLNDSILLNKDTSGIHLQISKGTPKDVRLMDRKIEPSGKVSFMFNKTLKNPDVVITYPPELDETKQINYNPTKDTASVWLADLTFDSLKVQILNDGNVLDSVTMRRGRNEKYDRDFIILDNLAGNKVTRVKHIQLTAGSPVQSIDRSKVVLTEDSIPRTNFQLAKDTSGQRKYILR